MTRRYQWALAVFAVFATAWIAFNIGFDLGSDTAACVAFQLADEKEASQVFCEDAEAAKSPVIQAVRKPWLTA